MSKHDVIFRDATLVDGTGAPRSRGDLAITDDRISAIGELSRESAGVTIDGNGLTLAPGFIDAHCHDDRALIDIPLLEAKVSQGVTSVINGNCGISVAPLAPGLGEPPQPITLVAREQEKFFARFADYFDALRADPPAVNSACLCGHSVLRHSAMADLSKTATESEISSMCKMLDEAMRDGAIGMSTGLYYPTAVAAQTEEVIAIAQCLAAHNGLYVTHMRNEAEAIETSLEETFRIGREAGIPVIVSHHKCVGNDNHGKSRHTLQMIDAARQHQHVGLDVYPYVATSTMLQPERVNQCTKVIVTWSSQSETASGRDLSDIAAEMGCSAEEAAVKLSPGGAVYFALSEDDVRRIMQYEHTMIGSDGIVSDKHPHPRAWGTFPRVLGHYSRDEQLFSLEEAVRKMTSLTAKRFGLTDRGELRVGAFADLVLFDAETIIDTADFVNPTQPAAGISQVFTNGRCVWRDGEHTGARPGMVLARSV